MNTRLCQKIAGRMSVLLLREIGHGIDPARMMAEPLYARDVLLVCEALPESELARLVPRYRRAAAADEEEANPARASSGFNPSRFLSSLFGTPSTLEDPKPPAAATERRITFARARAEDR